jgi:hypothetical protein
MATLLKMNYSRRRGGFHGIGTDDGCTYWGNYNPETGACYLVCDEGEDDDGMSHHVVLASRDEDGGGCGWEWEDVCYFLRHLSAIVSGITHG